MVNVLHRPGDCDLTADVDFAYLREAMQELGRFSILSDDNSSLIDLIVNVPKLMTQGDFLALMGIEKRVSTLVEKAETPERRSKIVEGANRLVDPHGMGIQYKVLGIVSMENTDVWPFDFKPS